MNWRGIGWTTPAVIAARWGLHDPAHLSRSMKAEFGWTPTEIRCASRTGTPLD